MRNVSGFCADYNHEGQVLTSSMLVMQQVSLSMYDDLRVTNQIKLAVTLRVLYVSWEERKE